MHRILLELPGSGFKLSTFSVFLLLACFVALWVTAWRARREGLKSDDVYELAIWLMGGGFIGARALYIAMHPESIHAFADIFRIWQGGIVFYGCIIGGLTGSVMFWTKSRFPFRPMADAVAPALVLGAGIGRIGCFFNGCCYGAVTDRPWALVFPAGSPPWARHVHEGLIPSTALGSLPVQPTQILATFDGLLIFGLLTLYFPRRKRDGEVMALLMVTYSVTRFLIDQLRQDEGSVFLGMTVSQVVSVVLFVSGLGVWAYLRRLPEGRFADRAARPQTNGDGSTEKRRSRRSAVGDCRAVVRPSSL